MTLSFLLGLGFLLLLVLLTGSLLLGENPGAKRLLVGIVVGFAALILILIYTSNQQSADDSEYDAVGSDIDVSPNTSFESNQRVNQSAAASKR